MDIKLKILKPLDLLPTLGFKYQMDIYDVPITEVIEQYLVYIDLTSYAFRSCRRVYGKWLANSC